ncbi:MAG: tetratricopeptide repeat protein [Bacteroidales bacterium]|nr:tetratricopeptide repeat protein [Bacteroidales bacterium]
MRNKIKYAAIVLLLLPVAISLRAQVQVGDSFAVRLEQAKELYNSGMYVSAERELEALADDLPDKHSLLYSEVMANKIMCAIALGRKDVDGLVKNLEVDFPNDPQLAVLKMNLADAKFDSQDYTEALVMYEGIQPRNLYRSAHTPFYFKKSYCSIYAGKYDVALEGFQKVIGKPQSQYTYPAIYYSGYVNYLEKRFDDAYSYFEAARKDSRFELLAEYYMVECKFMMKDYDYTIENGPKLYSRVNQQQKADLSRMVAESYFGKGDNQEAMRHLRQYLDSGANVTRKDRYFYGVLAYSLGDTDKAIEQLSQVTGNEDVIGQSSYYYLGNCFLKRRNKMAALEAFKAAAAMDYDGLVTEDALFNLAKLSYDVNKDISVFGRYVDRYPNSGKDDIINSYVATSSLEGKDYVSAIEALHKIASPGTQDMVNLQKALLLRSVELINSGSYRSAAPLLEEAEGLDANQMTSDVSRFYLADCYYHLGNYRGALSKQNSLLMTPEFMDTDLGGTLCYNLGYTHFKLGDFEMAAKYFEQYLDLADGSDREMFKDAGVRLADSYFMQNNYSAAAKEYERVATQFRDGDLYPWYQSALAYGLAGSEAKKQSILESAVRQNSNSPLYMNTLYELGRSYVQAGKNEKAKGVFNEIISSRDSLYYGRSLLEMAMINVNSGHYQQAISYYDKVVRQLPGTSDAKSALAGMESVYQLQNRPSEYLAYLDKVGMSDIKTEGEKEDMIYNAAEQIYLSGKHSEALRALRSYIDNYPNGHHTGMAYFYMAEAYRKLGRKEFAADSYEKAISYDLGEYSQTANLQYADLTYCLGQYEKASAAYQALLPIASDDDTRTKSRLGVMLSEYGSRHYMKAIDEAKQLRNATTDEAALRQADFISAKSYIVLGNREAAKPILTRLCDDVSDAIGAESAYILIEDTYNSGDYTALENMVYDFSDKNSNQVYWLAKSFIALGDSFADRAEWEQAKATWQSIADNYKSTGKQDDVLEQVKMRLMKVQSKNSAK